MSHDLDTYIATYRRRTTHAEHPKRTHNSIHVAYRNYTSYLHTNSVRTEYVLLSTASCRDIVRVRACAEESSCASVRVRLSVTFSSLCKSLCHSNGAPFGRCRCRDVVPPTGARAQRAPRHVHHTPPHSDRHELAIRCRPAREQWLKRLGHPSSTEERCAQAPGQLFPHFLHNELRVPDT